MLFSVETMIASRTLPEALAAYVAATKPGEHSRERVAVNLYHALPFAARVETLEVLSNVA
jgi:hypothetical protein